jgi:hypothetical protein
MSQQVPAVPLRRRFASPEERLRVLLLTNEWTEGDSPGQPDAFARLHEARVIEAFARASPLAMARTRDAGSVMGELVALIEAMRPNVIVQDSPHGFAFTRDWFHTVRRTVPDIALLLWEGDAWGRWSKPPPPETRLWWREADVVFAVAVGRQKTLIERAGSRDVRFVPNTYDHVRHREEEANEPPVHGDYSEVAVIGNWWGNRFFISRLPGARQRLRLVRTLQRHRDIPLAVYGHNWTGRGVRGPISRDEQGAVARRALMTANWDHYPNYAAFYSDRLAVHMLAGRPHVTTRHPTSEWLPGPESGLFLEPTVDAAVRRVRELLRRPRSEVLELGLAAHRWVRHRLSDRELARYMLGAVDERLLTTLPHDPWGRLPA